MVKRKNVSTSLIIGDVKNYQEVMVAVFYQ